MFKTIQQNKAPRQIIQQIRAAILEGELKPGNRLAAETELMRQFGVSKSTLREALRALEYLGLIEIRKGANGGAFVAEVDMQITMESLANFLHFRSLSIHHITLIRRNLEPCAAQIAAEAMSEEDLEQLKRLIEVSKSALGRGDIGTLRKSEIQFHRTIASASQNPILILILDFIENLLEDVKRILKPDLAFSKAVIESHKRICRALQRRDGEMASQEMLRDVLNVEKGLAALSSSKGKSVGLVEGDGRKGWNSQQKGE
jgi:GntR family transcriptional repressor for pyruvate dehydrogenase complex